MTPEVQDAEIKKEVDKVGPTYSVEFISTNVAMIEVQNFAMQFKCPDLCSKLRHIDNSLHSILEIERAEYNRRVNKEVDNDGTQNKIDKLQLTMTSDVLNVINPDWRANNVSEVLEIIDVEHLEDLVYLMRSRYEAVAGHDIRISSDDLAPIVTYSLEDLAEMTTRESPDFIYADYSTMFARLEIILRVDHLVRNAKILSEISLSGYIDDGILDNIVSFDSYIYKGDMDEIVCELFGRMLELNYTLNGEKYEDSVASNIT